MDVKEIVKRRGNARENLLLILHREQVEELAHEMDIGVADILGTASFYTLFSLEPRGRHIIRLCESPPCYVMGSDSILEAIGDKLGISFGETTSDGCFTLEATSCLGSCGVAPVMMVDDEIYGNLTRERVSEILDAIQVQDRRVAPVS